MIVYSIYIYIYIIIINILLSCIRCIDFNIIIGVSLFFVASVSQQVLEQLIKTMTNLLLSNKREIVKSALGFFKVCELNLTRQAF